MPLRQKKREALLLKLRAVAGNQVHEEKGQVVVEDRQGRATLLHYSEKNLLAALTKPSGVQLRFEYDADDRVSKVAFPGDESIALTYANDVPTQISLNGAAIHLGYDAKSRLNEVIYPDQKSVRFQYNELNQVTAVTNRVRATQTYRSLIEAGRLVHQMTDPLGRTTSLQMDTRGGLEKIVFPDQSTCEVRYDEVLDAEIVKLRNGTERITYLDGPYPYRVEWEDGTFQEITLNEGHLVESLENQAGTLAYAYDDQQRLLNESFQERKVAYAYEAEYLQRMVYPGGLEVAYAYDEDDRLLSIAVAGQTVRYAYAPNGTVAEIHYPNGLTEYQANQVLGGLQAATLATQSGEVVAQQSYAYDQLSRVVRCQQYSSYAGARNWEFGYDEEGRLTEATEATTGHEERFRYDPKGNLVQAGEWRVEAGPMDEVRSIGNRAVAYDRSGNVKGFADDEGRSLQLSYADDGTLKFASVNGVTWEYWYDGLGRRVGKSNGQETYAFGWAGEKLVHEEYRAGNTVTVREYIYADGDTPIGFREGGQLYWMQRDVRSAITEVYDPAGNLVWQARYSAFGKADVTTAAVRQPWRLAGQYHDEETGLHYNLARYYSPFLRAFLSLDPQWLKFEATNYSYAANDPYNRVDRNGKLPVLLVAVGVGAVVGAVVGAITTEGPWYRGALHGAIVGGAGSLGLALGAASSPIVALGGLVGFTGWGEVGASILDNVLDKRDICIPCALKAGVNAAAWAAVLGTAGAVIGKVIAPVAKRLLPRLAKSIPDVISKRLPKPPLRLAYEFEVKLLKRTANKMKKSGHSSEEIARKLHAERRALGVKYKDATPTELREEIYKRNLEKYGDELGPTIEYLRGKGKSWDEIIEKACTPGGEDLKFRK